MNAAADSPRARGSRVPSTPASRPNTSRSACPLVVRALPAGAGPLSERAARPGRRTGRTKRRQTPNEERRMNAAADSAMARGARTPSAPAGQPHASRSACACAPARGARPTRRRGDSERESGSRGATDGTAKRRARWWGEGDRRGGVLFPCAKIPGPGPVLTRCAVAPPLTPPPPAAAATTRPRRAQAGATPTREAAPAAGATGRAAHANLCKVCAAELPRRECPTCRTPIVRVERGS